MSQPVSSSPLSQYPGFFPASRPPFWRPARVGIAAGLLGLFLGIGIGAAGGQDTKVPVAKSPAPVVDADSSDVQAEVKEAVDAAAADAESKLERQRAAAETRLANVRQRAEAARTRAVRRAVTQAVSKARAQERAKTAAAVAAARTEAAQQPATAPVANAPAGTDPHFSYCYEVVAAGYGPYYEGQDPEYNWYTDADNDGSVCE